MPLDRTADSSFKNSHMIAWTSAATGLGAVIAVVVLGLTGHTEAATAAGVIGGGALAGGVSVTVNIRR